MGQSLQMAVIVLLALIAGVPLGGSLASSGKRVIGWLCVIFSATPIVVSPLVAKAITSMQQLTWEP
jgi:hypothetical protein